jgi:fructokinase
MISEPEIRLGIDLCGSKIELVAFDAAGRERLRRCVPTSRNEYRAALAAVRDLVGQSNRAVGNIGIGTPGSQSRASSRQRDSNSVCPRGTAGAR